MEQNNYQKLTPSHLKDELNQIVNELLVYEPEKIILYGSAARGEKGKILYEK